MKYKKYPSYKDSGIEWLGEIPEHWIRTKIKNKLSIPITDGPHETPEFFDEGVPFISAEAISSGIINFNKKRGCITEEQNIIYSRKYTPKQFDVYMIKSGATTGVCAIVETDIKFNIWSPLAVFRSGIDLNPYYLLNFLRSNYFQTSVQLNWSFGTQQNIGMNVLENLFICIPPFEEQQQIANFLDKATAKIDTLIEKQTKQIELLKEKRQTVISHAVIKGINPNVPMKDSGVEWLGDIPDHWEIKKAKNIASITRGAILRPVDAPEYFDENGEWAYLNISDATKCDKYLTSSVLRLSKLGSTKSARVYEDNVIITASATIGKAFINKIKVCVHDGFIPFCNIKISKDFLYHYLSNPYLYLALGKSNTQKNIYLDEVKQMMITIPSNEEQILIVKYIEDKTSKIDSLIEKSNKSIELLKEKRTALISAAVTGKIDVREFE